MGTIRNLFSRKSMAQVNRSFRTTVARTPVLEQGYGPKRRAKIFQTNGQVKEKKQIHSRRRLRPVPERTNRASGLLLTIYYCIEYPKSVNKKMNSTQTYLSLQPLRGGGHVSGVVGHALFVFEH